MNSLYPTKPGYTAASSTNGQGISYLFAFTLRSILNATTTEEVINRLGKYPIYSGYSLNVMSACSTSITNIEGYGNKLAIESRHGNSDVVEQSEGIIAHFNRYVNSVVEQDDGQGTSEERLVCAKKTLFTNSNDIRSFLGNLSCPVFFTESNGLGESETLASWVVDPYLKQCRMYRLPVDCDITKSRCYTPSITPSITSAFASAAALCVKDKDCKKDNKIQSVPSMIVPWEYSCTSV